MLIFRLKGVLMSKVRMTTYNFLFLVGSVFAWAEISLAGDFSNNPHLFCSQFAGNATKEDLVLDFPELTKVTDLVKFVKGHSNIDIAMDRNISGSLQIIAKEKKDIKIKCEEFLAALNNLNLTMVPQNGIFSLMKIRNAQKSSIPTFYPDEIVPETNQLVRKIVKIKHGNIKSLRSILMRMIQTHQIIAEPASNTLIVTESGVVINKLLKMIELFDRPCDSQCRKRVKEMNLEADMVKERQKVGKNKKVS